MLRKTPPPNNKFTRMIATYDPDVPGWLVFIVMALTAMTFIR